jgi:hypothetical protein
MTEPHPTPHRATDEQLSVFERLKGTLPTYVASAGIRHTLLALLEALAALEQRVEALEPLPPRVGHILRLAEIIREVDGNHDKGAAALAEAILSHPGIAELLHGEPPAAAPVPAAYLYHWNGSGGTYNTPPADAPAPPEDLVTEALRDQWFERYETQTKHPCGLLPVAAEHGYRLGYQAAMALQREAPAASPAYPFAPQEQGLLHSAAPAAAPAPPAGSLGEREQWMADCVRRRYDRSGAPFPEGHPRQPMEAEPAMSLVEVVHNAIAYADNYSGSRKPQARAAITAVAGWLERNHTGRIANGSQFADLLRETL